MFFCFKNKQKGGYFCVYACVQGYKVPPPPGTEPNSTALSDIRCPAKKLQSHQFWTPDIVHWTPDIGHRLDNLPISFEFKRNLIMYLFTLIPQVYQKSFTIRVFCLSFCLCAFSVPCVRCLVSHVRSLRCPMFGVLCPMSDVWCPMSNSPVSDPVSDVRCPAT